MKGLGKCFHQCGTSKGHVGFHTLYESVIGPRRDRQISLLEIGVDRGYSLEAWLQWMPKARVCGIDTFEKYPSDGIKVLSHPRVSWLQRDSTQPVLPEIGMFDYIIDDGCHWFDAQAATFTNYWPLVYSGGSYFIEDVWPWDLMSDDDKQHQCILNRPGAFSTEQFARLLDTISVGDVHRHDFRGIEGLKNSDHYILEIRK